MSQIVVVGAGVGGLSLGMLLAHDGHDVTVLERDPAPPPSSAEEAWDSWERRGVNQFRLLHYFQPRFRAIVESELPDLAAAFVAMGALRYNIPAQIPDEFKGGTRPDDNQFDAITARRPVAEAALASAAGATDGLVVRRGVGVAGLLTDTNGGVPHITGVRTLDGDDITADLVVDAGGRRSALPSWLAALGTRPPLEELEDCGFVYYGRHYRSSDGSLPPMIGPLLGIYGTISCLTLPCDNGTWGVGLIASAKDTALRSLREPDRWTRLAKSLPLQGHWVDGEPLEEDVSVMAKIEDRYRRYVDDQGPVVTGIVAVADAWACTNPSVGRGTSIGILHAVTLRDTLREVDTSDRSGFVVAFDEATERDVTPWYRSTLQFDTNRLGEIHAELDGATFETDDPSYEMTNALMAASGADGDVLRAFMKVVGVLELPDNLFADAELFEKVIKLGANWRDAEYIGPTRDEIVAIATN